MQKQEAAPPEKDDEELSAEERRLFSDLLDEVRRTGWFPARARYLQPRDVNILESLEERGHLTRIEDKTMWTLKGLMAMSEKVFPHSKFAIAELGRVGAVLEWSKVYYRHRKTTNTSEAASTMDELLNTLGWSDSNEVIRAIATIAHENRALQSIRLGANGHGLSNVDLARILNPYRAGRIVENGANAESSSTVNSGALQNVEDLPASLEALRALKAAMRLAATRDPPVFSSSCLFFGITELPQAHVDSSAAWLLRRHLIATVGDVLYRRIRDARFPDAERVIANESAPSVESTLHASAIVERARDLAVTCSNDERLRLRHLVAALAEEAHRVTTSPSRPSGLEDLVSEFHFDAAQFKKKMLAWLPLNAPFDNMAAWQRVLAPDLAPEPSPPYAESSGANASWSIHRCMLSDRATLEDSLGFAPYVDAVAEFLRHPDTQPPLTMSVEGAWGSGKSSFMMQLADALRKPAQPEDEPPIIVRFDAWRHAKSDEMWATFAAGFLDQVSRQQTWWKRWRGQWNLFWQRVKWRQARLEIARAILVGLIKVLMVAALALFAHRYWAELALARNLVADHANQGTGPLDKGMGALIVSGGGLGVLAFVLATLTHIKALAGGSLRFDLNKHVDSPDYERRAAFLDRFHDDFAKIVDAYIGHRRVYVFIDDLDRCEVPTAVDLMQALNLMTACAPKLIFIIGMDRERVAAGVASKYSPLLPYLRKPTAGLAFGLDFLEKFIQLPFELPQPDEAATRCMLWKFEDKSRPAPRVPSTDSSPSIAGTASLEQAHSARPGALEATVISRVSIPAPEETIAFSAAISTDSQQIRDITLAAARAFDFNPRKVKQFLNSFRLRAFVAWQLGRIELGERAGEGRMTLSQLGDQTARALRCPLPAETPSSN